MSRRTKKKPSPQPDGIVYPTVVLQLAKAFQAGEACGPGLHDALLEAGHPGTGRSLRGRVRLPAGRRLAWRSKKFSIPVHLTTTTRLPNGPAAARTSPATAVTVTTTKISARTSWTFAATLESAGIAKAEVSYNGNGDSGAVRILRPCMIGDGKEV